MKPFKKNLVIAVDGGGVRGAMVTRALRRVEEALKISLPERVQLFVGTSAGSVISTALACGRSATYMDGMYADLCRELFKGNWRTWPLLNLFVNYRYPNTFLKSILDEMLGGLTLGEFSAKWPERNLVMTTFDVVENRTRFIKTRKEEYENWPLAQAVMASSAAPTFFPVMEGRYIDGAIGSYNNPSYLAAYETKYLLKWKASEVTLLSIGTGRAPSGMTPGDAEKLNSLGWLTPILDGFGYSADDQQVHLVETFFKGLDFRRYQVDMQRPIAVNDTSALPEILSYGDQLGEMMLNDQLDEALGIKPTQLKKLKSIRS